MHRFRKVTNQLAHQQPLLASILMPYSQLDPSQVLELRFGLVGQPQWPLVQLCPMSSSAVDGTSSGWKPLGSRKHRPVC